MSLCSSLQSIGLNLPDERADSYAVDVEVVGRQVDPDWLVLGFGAFRVQFDVSFTLPDEPFERYGIVDSRYDHIAVSGRIAPPDGDDRPGGQPEPVHARALHFDEVVRRRREHPGDRARHLPCGPALGHDRLAGRARSGDDDGQVFPQRPDVPRASRAELDPALLHQRRQVRVDRRLVGQPQRVGDLDSIIEYETADELFARFEDGSL